MADIIRHSFNPPGLPGFPRLLRGGPPEIGQDPGWQDLPEQRHRVAPSLTNCHEWFPLWVGLTRKSVICGWPISPGLRPQCNPHPPAWGSPQVSLASLLPRKRRLDKDMAEIHHHGEGRWGRVRGYKIIVSSSPFGNVIPDILVLPSLRLLASSHLSADISPLSAGEHRTRNREDDLSLHHG